MRVFKIMLISILGLVCLAWAESKIFHTYVKPYILRDLAGEADAAFATLDLSKQEYAKNVYSHDTRTYFVFYTTDVFLEVEGIRLEHRTNQQSNRIDTVYVLDPERRAETRVVLNLNNMRPFLHWSRFFRTLQNLRDAPELGNFSETIIEFNIEGEQL